MTAWAANNLVERLNSLYQSSRVSQINKADTLSLDEEAIIDEIGIYSRRTLPHIYFKAAQALFGEVKPLTAEVMLPLLIDGVLRDVSQEKAIQFQSILSSISEKLPKYHHQQFFIAQFRAAFTSIAEGVAPLANIVAKRKDVIQQLASDMSNLSPSADRDDIINAQRYHKRQLAADLKPLQLIHLINAVNDIDNEYELASALIVNLNGKMIQLKESIASVAILDGLGAVDQSEPFYSAAKSILREGELLLQSLNQQNQDGRHIINEVGSLRRCIIAAERVVSNSHKLSQGRITSDEYASSVMHMKKLTATEAPGKASFCKRFFGALMVFVGVAIAGLAVAGMILSWGLSTAPSLGLVAGGAVSALSGIGLFAHGGRKGLADKLHTFAELAAPEKQARSFCL